MACKGPNDCTSCSNGTISKEGICAKPSNGWAISTIIFAVLFAATLGIGLLYHFKYRQSADNYNSKDDSLIHG